MWTKSLGSAQKVRVGRVTRNRHGFFSLLVGFLHHFKVSNFFFRQYDTGKGVRVPLPSCAITRIRQTFPEGGGTGFKQPDLNLGHSSCWRTCTIAKSMGLEHIITTPLSPGQRWGGTLQAVQTIKTLVKTTSNLAPDAQKQPLPKGVSPSQLTMGWSLDSLFPWTSLLLKRREKGTEDLISLLLNNCWISPLLGILASQARFVSFGESKHVNGI